MSNLAGLRQPLGCVSRILITYSYIYIFTNFRLFAEEARDVGQIFSINVEKLALGVEKEIHVAFRNYAARVLQRPSGPHARTL